MISKRLTSYKKTNGLRVFSLNILRRFTAFLGLTWSQGRKVTHYYKMAILTSNKYKFDMYLLKFPKGSYIDDHKDPAPEGMEHHRINLVLNKSFKGGKFVMQGKTQEGRLHKFRPDKYKHRVTKIKEGTRYVFSIGYLKKAA
jgi:hypothetical protein